LLEAIVLFVLFRDILLLFLGKVSCWCPLAHNVGLLGLDRMRETRGKDDFAVIAGRGLLAVKHAVSRDFERVLKARNQTVNLLSLLVLNQGPDIALVI